ncbi:hypothetical protein [Caldibacillus thermoamylovorans]|uniref:Uncharacterized protein n=1 Tax=Caldibacillus thermoamylovorans TaxID=35841 RepID=A0ABD4A959_9BACI|nr:hypothetical protein [Caldibacillus thermoamylovorans]KIO64785.1 hypothetical protein B4166_1254 [Caldibacillus thermoamylovorans]KIO72909.1 hypothetical protein B4167_2581 [Caldibacillus thermoamylovorans]
MNEIEGLTVGYEKQTTVYKTSFQIAQKIIEANICGKSSLVKAISGVIKYIALIFAKKKAGQSAVGLQKHNFLVK